MNLLQRAAGALCAALLGAAPAHAEDIDLYSAMAGSADAPNVLFVLDNSSNWSAASQAWTLTGALSKCNTNYATGSRQQALCVRYANEIFGAQTSLVQGQVELRALKLVLNSLVCSNNAQVRVNAGTMLFNTSGTVDGSSVVSGYVRQRVAPLSGARCADFLGDLDNIDAKITTPDFKGPSSAEYGAVLYEAFKYFGGYAGPTQAAAGVAGSPSDATHFGPVRYSRPNALEDPLAFTDAGKTTYRSPLGDPACGKNYIILIGNTWPNQEYGTDTSASPNPTNLLLKRLGHDTGAQIYPVPLRNADKSDVRFADEWARFLYGADVGSAAGQQNLRMLTIDVYNRSPDAKQSALLKSMADTNGPGGYFSVNGDLYGLVVAFSDALTTIAATNSVFASASLPVSVNAQGTFLNQVFMGVFRPDANAGPRWAGNLKQYQFARSGSSLMLADANGNQAVDALNTGFIQNCAASFWSRDSGNYWQGVGGSPSDCVTVPGSAYSDLPDGPLVERGGAAQRLRDLGHAVRNLRTCKDASCSALVDFTAANVTAIPGVDAAQLATLIAWVRGANTGDGAINASGVASFTSYGLDATATRPSVHGEVVHSRPLAVNYGGDGTDDVVVYYGSGDGTLRAVDGNTSGTGAGRELWAFIAPEHWAGLNRQRTGSPLIAYPTVSADLSPTPTPKTYFFDGPIGGYQERSKSGVSKLWIYPTTRRGGRLVYAFDVTSRPAVTAQPRLMWKFGSSDHASMGQSWSTPTALRVKGRTTPLLVFGAGYDACEDNEDPNTACAGVTAGRGIFVMNAEQGKSASADFRFIDPGATAGRFVADIAPVDINGDGYVDAFYAVDTRGNVWRINTSDPTRGYEGYASVADWPLVQVAAAGQWGAGLSERRKFLYAPSTVVLGSQVTVLLGSGDREKPSATSNAAMVKNRFYGLRDNATVTSGVVPAVGYGASPPDLYDVTGLTALDPLKLKSYKGWYFNLSTGSAPYEQVVTTPLTLGGVTYFSTFQVTERSSSDSSGTAVCASLGTGRAYQVDFQTGSALPGVPLVTTFIGQGIPPSPVGGVVTIDGVPTPFLIGGTGPTVLTPTKVIPKVKPNRKPVYRYQRID